MNSILAKSITETEREESAGSCSITNGIERVSGPGEGRSPHGKGTFEFFVTILFCIVVLPPLHHFASFLLNKACAYDFQVAALLFLVF